MACFCFGSRSARLLVTVATLAIGTTLGACGDDDGDALTLLFLNPSDGDRFDEVDDVDPAAAGVQIDIALAATGLDAGETVNVWLDTALPASPGTEPGEPDASGMVGPDGTVSIRGFTVPLGEHTLLACARQCMVNRTTRFTVVMGGTPGGCPAISFVDPVAVVDDVVLGPSSDVDGEPCGETFTIAVRAFVNAPDGTAARIFVNDTPTGTTTVSGSFAEFPSVVLGNRGDTPNRMRIETDGADGICTEEFPQMLFVDCEGVSCAITAPDADRTYLNADDDVSEDSGFQGNFEVTTGGTGPDLEHDVELIVDGDEGGARRRRPVADGRGGVATFTGISLDEGEVMLQARCRDDMGNATLSTPAEWIVDTVPCSVALTSPLDGAELQDSDDLDAGEDGIQIDAGGTVSGDGCESVEVGPCGSAGADADVDGESWTARVTLGSEMMQDVCAVVTDVAGNEAEASVSLIVRTDGPELEITSPDTDTSFNGATELDDSSPTCEVSFTVDCSAVGAEVELVRASTGSVLVGGRATCEASGDGGEATFASVSLPSLNDGSSLDVFARSTVDGATGRSAAITLTPDCEAPAIGVSRPVCGSRLPAGTTTLEVAVLNANVPKFDVVLEIRDAGGGLVHSDTRIGPAGPTTIFPDADFSGAGPLTISACSTDSAGNTGCHSDGGSACTVDVGDLPTLEWIRPTDGAVLTSWTDCDAGAAGDQLRVRIDTDAPVDSDATLSVGGGAPIAATVEAGGFARWCVDVPEGSVTFEATVTDARGTARGSISAIFDTTPPTVTVDDLRATVASRRAGRVTFEWTEPDDDGMGLATFEVRCHRNNPITNETRWERAEIVYSGPGMGIGAARSETVSHPLLFPPISRNCAVRGIDAGGRLTPLTPTSSIVVDVDFLTADLAGGDASIAFGSTAVAVGDVNSDGFDDILVGTSRSGAGGLDNRAYLFFGAADGPSSTPSVTLSQGAATSSFGRVVAGVGDMNGDSIPDFAIARFIVDTVYVFFGRDADTPWPTTLDADADADLTFVGPGAGNLTGFSLAPVDFNGDDVMDLAIGSGPLTARAFVVLGSDELTSGMTFMLGAAAASEPAGFDITGPDASRFGLSLASPGDTDGDGNGELVVGAPGGSGMTANGAVYLVRGAVYGAGDTGLVDIAPAALTEIDTGDPGLFGPVVSAVGDWDGDGRQDIGVWVSATVPQSVWIYRQGTDGTFVRARRHALLNDLAASGADQVGITIGHGFHPDPTILAVGSGASARRLGDIDGDGLDDVVTGSDERGTEGGSVDLWRGRSPIGSQSRNDDAASLHPAGTGRRIGQLVGDVNGDGYTDIFVGDPTANSGTLHY